MTGSSLIALGLTWWQAIIAIIVGAILSTVFIVLNSMPGAFYHLGFPIANRYVSTLPFLSGSSLSTSSLFLLSLRLTHPQVWGMYGSSFVIYNRILLSLVWYAVQSWIGGQCVYVCLEAIWPNLEDRIPNHIHATGLTSATFLSYVIFCLISLPLIWIRPHKLKVFLYVGVASILVFEVVLLIWALATMDGFGSTISSKPAIQDTSVGWMVLYGIISAIGGIAAGILNQSDYARFAKRPRDAIWGQIASAATYSIISSVIGILVTAATQQRYGEALWSLPDLLVAMMRAGHSRSRAAGFFAGAALVISQWGINIPGNALSGGFDLAATFPTFINIRRGAYITALLSMVVNPWQLLASASTFLAVLSSYGVFLGPMVSAVSSCHGTEDQQERSSHYWLSLCGRCCSILTIFTDWSHDFKLLHRKQTQNQSGRFVPWKQRECVLVYLGYQLACTNCCEYTLQQRTMSVAFPKQFPRTSMLISFLFLVSVGTRSLPQHARIHKQRQQFHHRFHRMDKTILHFVPGRVLNLGRHVRGSPSFLPRSSSQGICGQT